MRKLWNSDVWGANLKRKLRPALLFSQSNENIAGTFASISQAEQSNSRVEGERNGAGAVRYWLLIRIAVAGGYWLSQTRICLTDGGLGDVRLRDACNCWSDLELLMSSNSATLYKNISYSRLHLLNALSDNWLYALWEFHRVNITRGNVSTYRCCGSFSLSRSFDWFPFEHWKSAEECF